MAYRFNWTPPLVTCLLNNYMKHPFLYIQELPDYKDKTERKVAMEEIKSELLKEFPHIELTIDEIRKKLQSLKSQYNRERKSTRSEPTLWCFEQMQILWGTSTAESTNKDIKLFNKSTNDKVKKELQNDRCRICLIVKSGGIALDSNISIQQDNLLLSELLSSIANIKFDEEENKKPQTICQSCVDIAKIAYEFKLTCEQSDTILTDELLNILINENNYIDINEIKEEYIDENIDNEGDVLSEYDDEQIISDNKITEINQDLHKEENREELQNETCELKFDSEKHETFTCLICNKKFQRRQHLSNHLWLHKNQRKKKKTLKCPYCDFIPESSAKLGKHTEREHNDMKKISCPKCDKKFMTKNNLRAHQATHMEKNYTCEYCGNIFANAQNLKKHHLTHTGEKPYSCTICGKQFTQQSILYTHNLYMHSDKRDFKCKECGAGFKRAGALNKHLRVHTGERPYKCSVCSTSARDLSSLRRHMKIHTGEYDYKCDVCGKNFIRKSSLKVHMMTHTGEKPHVCDICGNRFSQAHCLRSHMATQHKIIIKTKTYEVKSPVLKDEDDNHTVKSQVLKDEDDNQ